MAQSPRRLFLFTSAPPAIIASTVSTYLELQALMSGVHPLLSGEFTSPGEPTAVSIVLRLLRFLAAMKIRIRLLV
jgi:hypothetical protein